MNKINFFKLLISKVTALVILILLLNACATVYSGTTQNINVQAIDLTTHQPLDDISCMITNINGNNYYVFKNPGMVTIPKIGGILKTKCIKEGYKQINYDVQNDFNFIVFANIAFWPGFIVDASSDSIYRYPVYITIFMDKIS